MLLALDILLWFAMMKERVRCDRCSSQGCPQYVVPRLSSNGGFVLSKWTRQMSEAVDV